MSTTEPKPIWVTTCSLCNGSGSVARTSFADPKNDISVNCHVCKGTGKLYDKDSHIAALQQQLAERDALLAEVDAELRNLNRRLDAMYGTATQGGATT